MSKYVISSSPHLRDNVSTTSIMRDVCIALLPAAVAGVLFFGYRSALILALSVAAAVLSEWLYCKATHSRNTIGDFSAVVTGMLLAFVCPVTTPYWMILIGDFFAIVVVKQLFGGIGKNFVNPALAGRAFLLGSYAGEMTKWIAPGETAPLFGSTADIVTAATPLAYMKTGDMETLMSTYSINDMFLGKIGGSLGEISVLMLLIGGIYLIVRKVINWQTPVGYIATVAVLSFLFPKAGSGLDWMLYSIFGGGLMLGAFFMATDYTTSPVTTSAPSST